VPDTLQWDLWLGPNAYRPYHPLWMNRHTWREFGTSQLGNIAMQFEEAIEFDVLACKIPGNSAADDLLLRECREGWSL